MKKILFMIILLAMNVSAANVIFKEGALDVDSSFASDYLKLDATSTPPVSCSATEQGAMYYDNTTDKYKYCDGIDYEEIGSGVSTEEIRDGLVLSYNFEEDNIYQDIIYDTSIGNTHGTIYGAVHKENAGYQQSGAVYLDGSDDYISIDSILPTLNTTKTGTFAAWINGENYNANDNILSFGDNDADSYIILNVLPTYKIRFMARHNGVSIWRVDTNMTLNENQLYHIVATYGGDGTNSARVYINGVNQSFSVVTQGNDWWFNNYTSLDNAYIGRLYEDGDASAYFNGTIDDFKIFNRALNASEIQTLYEQSKDTHISTPTQKDIMVSSDQEIIMPQVYSNTVGATKRSLYIDNNGEIGGLYSSGRYKENIQNLENAEWLYHLNPVTFDYIEKMSGINQMGLIAEDVEKVNPNIVSYHYDKETDTKIPETVNYHDLVIPILVELQNHRDENQLLKSELCKKDNSYTFCNQAVKAQSIIQYIEQPDFKGIIPKIKGEPIKNTYK